MKKLIVFSLLIISINSFSQEHLEQFKGLTKNKFNLSGIIPEVSWKIDYVLKNSIYEYQIPVKNSNNSTQIFDLENGNKIELSLGEIKLKSEFPPNVQQNLASVFYELGVEYIILEGITVSIYQFSDAYKALTREKITQKRTYLKN